MTGAPAGVSPAVWGAITSAAGQYGVDPLAMAAVGRVESGLNPAAVGDSGHSIGLFQLADFGAGHGMSAAARSNPYTNALTAARDFAQSGGRGLHGPAAVRAFVQNFERPANPGAEIQRALGYYGGGGGGASSSFSDPYQGTSNIASAVLSPQALTALTAYLVHAGRTAAEGHPIGEIPPGLIPQLAAGAGGGTGLGNIGSTGTGLLGAAGKVIGLPYQGTHGKAFNVRGGSDNWASENAIDIAVPVGTPIYAPEAGVIDPAHYGSQGIGGRFAGLRVNLLGSNPMFFGHLSRIAVAPGARVQQGQLIGYTGSADGVAHLHFAVQNGDPQSYYA